MLVTHNSLGVAPIVVPFPTIIAIALTGWTEDEIRQRAVEAGFDHYVVKPVEAAMLTKLLGTPEARGTTL